MFEAGLNSGMTMNFDSVNEDAAKILTEAATVAEQRVSANFPELPQNLAGNVPGAKISTQRS
jgi:division protein CdvB (Snf7/Vps24/ESCRT-III family)